MAIQGEPYKADSKKKLKKLEQHGSKVIKAEYTKILYELDAAIKKTIQNGLFICSFSTHGYMKDGDCLLCSDSTPTHIRSSSIKVHEILETVSKYSDTAESRIVFFDACRESLSGSRGINNIADGDTAMSDSLHKLIVEAKGTAVLFSTVPKGYSFEDKDSQNGLFTSCVLKGINGKAADVTGNVTLGSLTDYVNREVKTWVGKYKPEFKENSGISFNVDDVNLKNFVLAQTEHIKAISVQNNKKKFILLASNQMSPHERREFYDLLHKVILPACGEADYELLESNKGHNLLDCGFSALSYTELVIAYMDRINNDDLLMAKIGFRLASGKPFICLQKNINENSPAGLRGVFGSGNNVKIRLDNMQIGNPLKIRLHDEILRLENEYVEEGQYDIYPTTIINISDDVINPNESYVYCDKDAAKILSPKNNCDPYEIIHKQGQYVADKLVEKIIPNQWYYFKREQDNLYANMLSHSEENIKTTPIANIPMVFDVNGEHKAILPMVTQQVSENGEHQFKIIHIEVTELISLYADGHYELTPSTGKNGLKHIHNYRQHYNYSLNPAFKLNKEGIIVTLNLTMEIFLGKEKENFLNNNFKKVLNNIDEAENISEFPFFDFESPLCKFPSKMQHFTYRTIDFGQAKIRGYIMPILDMVNGECDGYSWGWEIVEIANEDKYEKEIIDRFNKSYLWNRYASSYDQVLPYLSYYQDLINRHVEKLSSCKAVADVGTGTGNLAVQLLEKGIHVTALDLSKSMLFRLEAKISILEKKRLKILHSNAENLSMLTDESFDGVSVMMALYDMDSPTRALKECIRILRRGGIIVITDPKPGITNNVEKIILNAERELKNNYKYTDKLEHWNVVKACGRALSKKAEAPPYPDDIINILEKCNFIKIKREESHYGTCETITAIKKL